MGSGVRAAGTGHEGASADGVVRVAVGEDCTILNLRAEVAVSRAHPEASPATSEILSRISRAIFRPGKVLRLELPQQGAT